MCKTKKVVDIQESGRHFSVVKHAYAEKPYYVYEHGYDWNENGYIKSTRNLLVKCDHIKIALAFITNQY